MKKANVNKLIMLMVVMALFTGCSSPGLSEDFNEDEVKTKAKEVITLMNEKDSEALLGMSTVQMKEALTEDVLNQVYAAIDEGGEFVEFQDISVGGQKDQSSNEEFAVTVVNAKYEIKNFTYTISFTKQMKLAGLFYK